MSQLRFCLAQNNEPHSNNYQSKLYHPSIISSVYTRARIQILIQIAAHENRALNLECVPGLSDLIDVAWPWGCGLESTGLDWVPCRHGLVASWLMTNWSLLIGHSLHSSLPSNWYATPTGGVRLSQQSATMVDTATPVHDRASKHDTEELSED